MENKKVAYGETYWCIIVTFNNIIVRPCVEIGEDETLVVNNYFKTKEEAESMARKLRAVLNGADVIDSLGNINICDIENNSDYEDGVSLGWQKCYNWIKSKKVI